MDYTIITDTSANLPSAYVSSNSIGVIPFSFYINKKEYTCLDSDGFNAAEYYTLMTENIRITTSQITPYQYIAFFKPFLEAEKDILFVGMSSGISGSFASAEIAAKQLREDYPERNIRLVDSLGASLGEGLLVMKAVECREAGMTIDETANEILRIRHQIYQVFTVDDLKYLHRGGRLSNPTAIVGSILNIKPILIGNRSGKIVSIGKVRGRKRTIQALASKYNDLVVSPETQTVGISHANCREDAETLVNLISSVKPPKKIVIVDHEPATGSYLGPGALALYFQGSPLVREY